MTIVLEFDGNDDYCAMDSQMDLAVGEVLTIRARGFSGNAAGTYRLTGRDDGFLSLLEVGSNDINVRLGNSTQNHRVSTGYTQPALNVWFVLELDRTSSSSYEVRLDGAVIGTISSTLGYTPNAIGGFDQQVSLSGQIEYITNGTANDWRPNDSVHTAGTPVITDTISGNDATGVNMPTAALGEPGSAWIDIGGSGITVTLDSGSYSLTGTDVNLKADYREIISTGAYAYTGTDIILVDPPTSQTITIDPGSYLLTGTLIQTAIKTQVNTDSYALTGTAINFAITRGMTIEAGSYIIQGTDIEFSNTGNIWTDKPSVVTLWGDKTPVITNWTDK